MIKNTPHYAVGHINPDTDSVVSAYVLAWLHNQLSEDERVTPLRLGEINTQTAWLFEQAGVEVPELRESCLYQAREMCRSLPTVSPDSPLREALEKMQRAETGFVAVVDKQNHPIGIVSDRTQRTNYLLQCNVEDFIGTLLDFNHIVNGLPLVDLKPDLKPAVDRLEIALHDKINLTEDQKGTALIMGDNEPQIRLLSKSPPEAIILAGMDIGRANELNELLTCAVYHFPGSIISMLMRLPGCFPASSAMMEDFIVIDEQTQEDEISERIKESPWGLMVQDVNGRVSGAISPMDVLNTPRPKISLVDHSEKGQSIHGLQDAEVLEIIDHHRLGDIETIQPLSMDVRPLGSTASILYNCIVDTNIEVPSSIAKLLLGAVISDTLLLTSPTCTNTDKNFAQQLADKANVDLKEFGVEVLRQNDELTTAAPDHLVKRDCKRFTFESVEFLAAQIETIDLSILSDSRLKELRDIFAIHVNKESTSFGILMFTDVLKSNSRIVIVSEHEKWKRILIPEGIYKSESPWLLEKFVSRKKQLIPLILNTIRKTLR